MAVGDQPADEAGPHVAAAEKGDLLILHNVSIIPVFAVYVGTDLSMRHRRCKRGSVPGSFGSYRVLGPNSAVPTLMTVAPSAIAARISLVVPMDSVSSR